MKHFSKDPFLVAALFLLASLACLVLELSHPFFFLTDDNACQLFPSYAFTFRSIITDFTIPVINFHQYLGQSFMQQGFNAPLYPPIYLAGALSMLFRGDLLAMMDILAWLHLAAGGIVMFFWLRCLKVDALLCLAGALLWATNPYLLYLGRACILVIYVALYIPLTFWLLERMFKKPCFSFGLGLVLCEVMLFFQANVQLIFFLGFFELIYLGIRLRRLAWSSIRQILKFLVLPHLALPLLVAPVLLPLLKGAENSFSRSHALLWTEKLAGSVNPADFILAQLFWFRPFAFEGDNRFLFLGIAVLPIVLFLLPDKVKKPCLDQAGVRTLFLLACIALVLSTPLYALIAWFPPFSKFRWPYKFFCFAPFFLISTLGLIFQQLVEMKKTRKTLFVALLLFSVINLAVMLFRPQDGFMGVVRQPPQASPFLTELAGQNQRVTGYGVPVEKDHSLSLSYNFATLYGAYSFLGYDALLSRKVKAIAPKNGWRGYYDNLLDPAAVSILSSWSVRYLIAPNSSEMLLQMQNLGFPLIKTRGELALFENPHASPLANPGPNTPLPDVKIGINKVEAQWTSPLASAGSLILNIIPATDIECTGLSSAGTAISLPWSEQDDRIHLEIPAGIQRLSFEFHDRQWEQGIRLFWLGVLYLALLPTLLKKIPLLSF